MREGNKNQISVQTVLALTGEQVEQFVESIFPTQDPKALALIHKNEVSPADAQKAAESAESKKDVFFIMLAVFGTLFLISSIMVRSLPSPPLLSPPHPIPTLRINLKYRSEQHT